MGGEKSADQIVRSTRGEEEQHQQHQLGQSTYNIQYSPTPSHKQARRSHLPSGGQASRTIFPGVPGPPKAQTLKRHTPSVSSFLLFLEGNNTQPKLPLILILLLLLLLPLPLHAGATIALPRRRSCVAQLLAVTATAYRCTLLFPSSSPTTYLPARSTQHRCISNKLGVPQQRLKTPDRLLIFHSQTHSAHPKETPPPSPQGTYPNMSSFSRAAGAALRAVGRRPTLAPATSLTARVTTTAKNQIRTYVKESRQRPQASNRDKSEPTHAGTFARTDDSITVEYPEDHELPSSGPIVGAGRAGLHVYPTLAAFSLQGNVGVVTGGARGLGLVMGQGVVVSGADLAIVDMNSKSPSPRQPESASGWRRSAWDES